LYEAVESEEECIRMETKRLEAAILIQVGGQEAAILIQLERRPGRCHPVQVGGQEADIRSLLRG
jgi:hypothetical protein